MEADTSSRAFGALDDGAYAEGEIGRKHRELMGLATSIGTHCDECVLYRLDGSRSERASRKEIVAAMKTGVAADGSITALSPDSPSRPWMTRGRSVSRSLS